MKRTPLKNENQRSKEKGMSRARPKFAFFNLGFKMRGADADPVKSVQAGWRGVRW